MKRTTIFTLALVGLALLLTGSVAEAAKKGPRASVASWTACSLDLEGGGAFLVVKTTLTNISSGGRVAEVRGGKLKGTYKAVGTRGNENITFDSKSIEDILDPDDPDTLPEDIDPTLEIEHEFDICDIFELARALNGRAIVEYGLSGGSEDSRTVKNRCNDDPETPENEGPIYVADYFDLIDAACNP